jgi:cytidyltransferase-like protein
MKYKIGAIHGRFQMLHLGHMEYLLAGKARCDFLYIGITNPDPRLSSENESDLKRTEDKSNPFTYFERLEMVRDAMLESGVGRHEFEIVPFPINFPELIKYYIPLEATFFLTLYDEWGQHKLNTIKSLGVKTDVMWVRTMDERLTSGTEVRKLFASGNEWEHLVPKSVAIYIKRKELIQRLEELFKK